VKVDRTGNAQTLSLLPKSYAHPKFSPTGDRLLYWVEQSRCDIEVADLARGGATIRLTSEGDNHFPVWMPDGLRVAYVSRKVGAPGYALFSRPANGSGTDESILPSESSLTARTSLAWSRNGTLAFASRDDLWIVPPSGNREPRPFASSRFIEMTPTFSPDGRWLAYVSDELNGRFEVYVQPFPGPGAKTRLSISGGTEPVWAPNGQELFYRNGDQMMVVRVSGGSSLVAATARELFARPFARTDGRINYDVAPDGQSFVMVSAGEGDRPATEIHALLNWHDELKRLVPAR
jgi:Tol biopolymer transport system component